MDATIKPLSLATHLDEAARRIETGEAEYEWDRTHSCNCGVLAQVITGNTADELEERIRRAKYRTDIAHEWSDAETHLGVCAATDMPLGTIVRTLGEAGLSFADFKNIEYLKDAAVLAEAGLEARPEHFNRENVARYFRAFARLIRRSHEQTATAPASDILATSHPVSVLVS